MINWAVIKEDFNAAPVSIIGIDPGTDTMGLAVLTFNPITFDILHTEARTYIASRELPDNWINDYISNRESRLRYLGNTLFQIFNNVKPFMVVAESNFMRLTRPMAYGALVEIVSTIRRSLYDWNPTKILYMVDPNKAKSSVGVLSKDYSRKEAVREALINLPLNFTGNTHLSNLDSHSSDAIAIAYMQYLWVKDCAMVKNNLIYQYQYNS